MKLFLTITAISEVLIGILLIIVPKQIVKLLFDTSLDETGGIISAMIAGAAIISLTMTCWLMKNNALAYQIVKAMTFYNLAIIAVVFYGFIFYKLQSIFIWIVIGFHMAMALWSVAILKKGKENEIL